MRRTAEIVIVGGGVVGCAVAYNLAKMGMKDIVLVEKKFLASGSTGRCGGGIRQQWSTAPNVRLAMASVSIFERMEEELGMDVEWYQGGYLIPAYTEDEWKQFQKNVQMQRGEGLDVRVLEPQETQDIVPGLNTEGMLGATYCPKDGDANPFLVTIAYAKRAKDMGVTIETFTEVVGINVEGGRIQGVRTSKGYISTGRVFNAAGGYSGEIGKMVGIDLPVTSYRHEIMVTEPVERFIDPMVISFSRNIYFRQAETGGIIGGQSNPGEPPGTDMSSGLDFAQQFAKKVTWFVPALRDVKVVRQWAGLYNVTPDAQPILGSVDEVEGYFHAIGFSGHGFMIAPKTAELMAELIVYGKTSMPIDDLHLNRFKEGRIKDTEKSVV